MILRWIFIFFFLALYSRFLYEISFAISLRWAMKFFTYVGLFFFIGGMFYRVLWSIYTKSRRYMRYRKLMKIKKIRRMKRLLNS